ncbi:hypothetical protein Plec18167_006299 [Paecilomyces lecythidis]|uniref:Uncharacterized protein n=1 Tax=Paecilomyces lecythidis TaxID=3004212 RepID=A0ABR3XCY1_9EURO
MLPRAVSDNQIYIQVYEDEPLPPPPPASDTSSNSQKFQSPSRYYSTPLNADVPDSTPLKIYGLKQRPPSVVDPKPPKLLSRLSMYAFEEGSQEKLPLPRVPGSPIKKAASVMERQATPTEPSPPSRSLTRRPSVLSFDMLSSSNGSQESVPPPLRRIQSRLSVFRSSSSSSRPDRKRWLSFKKRTATDPELAGRI